MDREELTRYHSGRMTPAPSATLSISGRLTPGSPWVPPSAAMEYVIANAAESPQNRFFSYYQNRYLSPSHPKFRSYLLQNPHVVQAWIVGLYSGYWDPEHFFVPPSLVCFTCGEKNQTAFSKNQRRKNNRNHRPSRYFETVRCKRCIKKRAQNELLPF